MRPIVLMVLDGWGMREEQVGNGIFSAKTPNFDQYIKNYAHSTLLASGEAVGLPEGQQGNSEVGHLNLGAGRVVYQDLTKINKAIREKTFFENQVLSDTIRYCKENQKPLHIMGLLSPGGVHSHSDHLKALVELAKKNDLSQVYIHGFLDGRDVPPDSALEYVKDFEEFLTQIGIGKIASLGGRYYGMDRDNRWERVEKGYRAIIGEGVKEVSAQEAIEKSYANKVYDEFVEPITIVDSLGQAIGSVQEEDALIFANFRADRAREISRVFAQKDFDAFERGKYLNVRYVAMTLYSDEFADMMEIIYPPEDMANTLGEVLAKNDLRQLRIAETEKYAHVTSFFNGSIVEPNVGEDRILVASPKVATYDLKPQMSAYEVTDKMLEALDSNQYDFLLINYANCDMVGHTGIFEAAVTAVETVDECVGKVVEAVLNKKGAVLLTADHGNAEKMIDENGGPFTAHTSNQVPFIAICDEIDKVKNGSLQDVAPTVLALFNIEKPAEMTGDSLIIFKEEV